MAGAPASIETHTVELCPACGVRRVPGASACWQCGSAFGPPAPKPPVSPVRWVKVSWIGVAPFGLFFLPWVIAGPYWAHRVVSVAGLELALGQTLKGRPVPQEPLLWLIPAASLLLGALLFSSRRQTPEPRQWLLVAITAWVPFLLLLIKAILWLWPGPAPGTGWVVHWLTTEFLVTGSAFFIAGLAAMRNWRALHGARHQPSPTPSQDTPCDDGPVR